MTDDQSSRPAAGRPLPLASERRAQPARVACSACASSRSSSPSSSWCSSPAAINPLFLSPQGVKDLLLNATIVIILAVGQALVIITAQRRPVGRLDPRARRVRHRHAVRDAARASRSSLVFLVGMVFGAVLGASTASSSRSRRCRPSSSPSERSTSTAASTTRGPAARSTSPDDRPEAFGNLSVDTVLGFPLITLIAVIVVVDRRRSSWPVHGRAATSTRSAPTRMPRGCSASRSSRACSLAFVANGVLAGLAGVLYTSRFNSVGRDDRHRPRARRGRGGRRRRCRDLRRQRLGRRRGDRRPAPHDHHERADRRCASTSSGSRPSSAC